MNKKYSKKGQVWIETVIYTLLGLVVIGLLLAFAKPRIESMRDKSILEQSIASFNSLNSKIQEVQANGPENSRQIDLKISRGRLVISPTENKISWIIESSYKLSEPGYTVQDGELSIITTQKTGKFSIELFKIFNSNITVNNEQFKKELTQSSNPYSIIVKNNGISQGNIQLDISV